MSEAIEGREPHAEPKLPELRRREEREVEQRAAPRVRVLHEAIRREGEDELARPVSALAWSGLAAGLSMGFSMAVQGMLHARLPDEPWRPLVAGFGYCVGFLLVVLGRQQLFTENTLTVVLPLLAKRDAATLAAVARLWAVVLAANLAGAFAFAWAAAHTDVFSPAVRQAFVELGRDQTAGGFGNVLLRGVFAGWLIALMVWLLPSAKASRTGIIVVLTYVVSLAGLTHVIAGSVEAFYLFLVGELPAGRLFAGYLLPTLLGNVLGGVALVSALNHAQVVSGIDHAAGDA